MGLGDALEVGLFLHQHRGRRRLAGGLGNQDSAQRVGHQGPHHRRQGHGDQEAHGPAVVLAQQQRQHHQGGVQLGVVADDLGVEEVGLEQVDGEDPQQHQKGRQRRVGQAHQHGGDGAHERAEDGNQAEETGHHAQGDGELHMQEQQADGGEHAVDDAYADLAAHRARQAAVDVANQRLDRAAVLLGHQLVKPGAEAGQVVEQKARQHEDQHQHQDGREHAGDEVAGSLGELADAALNAVGHGGDAVLNRLFQIQGDVVGVQVALPPNHQLGQHMLLEVEDFLGQHLRQPDELLVELRQHEQAHEPDGQPEQAVQHHDAAQPAQLALAQFELAEVGDHRVQQIHQRERDEEGHQGVRQVHHAHGRQDQRGEEDQPPGAGVQAKVHVATLPL
ncbi:hypothetical protein D3C72_1068340 [compost metagenome]